jgi:L-seryl-tRNA(Ser) seleniumtransferase
MTDQAISRREWLRRSGELGTLLALPAIVPASAEAAASAAQPSAAAGLRLTPDAVYQSIGVRPLINARGTFTIVSGSTMLPEVRAAMDAAAQRYVHLDELTEAIGARLAALTSAEWGLVTNGCAAGLTLAAAACIAGGNPDLHIRIPNLAGFAKDEVIIPTHSRNVYDAALRAVGVRVTEVSTVADLESALGQRTALIYILAGPNADNSPLSVKAIAPIAQAKGVPILVDAAAEILTIPNVHLQNGATLVAYSGGKCLRGPQTAGLLLGRKDLVKAAWVHSAPHHGFGRSLKVGKEDAIGMLMAVEMWVKRDHDAEWKRWTGWLEHIAKRVSGIDGVTTHIVQPNGLSNKTPSLRIQWDRQRLGIAGDAVVRELFDGEPRITVAGGGGGGGGAAAGQTMTGISVTPYMMAAGEEKIVADRVHAILSKAPRQSSTPAPLLAAADISGTWNVRIQFAAGTANHTLNLAQKGADLTGFHQGEFLTREVTGTVDQDNNVRVRSAFGEQHGDSINLTFSGKIAGNEMSGSLDMGEYLAATWTASRRQGRRS